MNIDLPIFIKSCLWSYDLNNFSLDNSQHKKILIFNILNYGTIEALFWLLKNFSKNEIVEVIQSSSVSSWNKKSLVFSNLLFDSYPRRNERFS